MRLLGQRLAGYFGASLVAVVLSGCGEVVAYDHDANLKFSEVKSIYPNNPNWNDYVLRQNPPKIGFLNPTRFAPKTRSESSANVSKAARRKRWRS